LFGFAVFTVPGMNFLMTEMHFHIRQVDFFRSVSMRSVMEVQAPSASSSNS
jgi:hypothetical protein